jgi:hypothetical protein
MINLCSLLLEGEIAMVSGSGNGLGMKSHTDCTICEKKVKKLIAWSKELSSYISNVSKRRQGGRDRVQSWIEYHRVVEIFKCE